MRSLLSVALPEDTPSRIGELVAAAYAARGDSPYEVEILWTVESADGDSSAFAADVHQLCLSTSLDTLAPAEQILDVIAQVCIQRKPDMLFLSADGTGLELGARLGARLDAPCISGCCAFERTEDGALLFVRPVYGGRALEVLASDAPFTVVCIKPKSFHHTPSTDVPLRQAETLHIEAATVSKPVTRVEGMTTQNNEAVNLEEAALIVSGGRGVDGANGFAQLSALAQVLGGALGASRAAVDAGWISSVHQVGQTGKTVAPELYLAVGISGAMQHLAGISAAKRIVAINTDDQAPIFGVADVGIVANAGEVISALLEEFKRS